MLGSGPQYWILGPQLLSIPLTACKSPENTSLCKVCSARAMWQSPCSVWGISQLSPGLQEPSSQGHSELQGTAQEGPFLWCRNSSHVHRTHPTEPTVQKHSSDPQHSSAGGSFWSSGHLRCKDLQVPPAPSSPADVRHVQDLAPGWMHPLQGGFRWQSSGETQIRFQQSQRHHVCQHGHVPPLQLLLCLLRAAGLLLLLRPCLTSDFATTCKSTVQRLEWEHLNLRAWTSSLSVSPPSILRDTLYSCSCRRETRPSLAANTGLANKLQKDSWGTR